MSPLFGSRRPPSGGATFLFLGRLMASSHYRRILNQSRAFRESLTPAASRQHDYALRPVDYAREVLGVTTLTQPQIEILEAIHRPPCRVLVPSAHDVGKTFCAAVAACYWYDSFNPGLVLTTAPTEKDVIDLLWTEIRLLRMRAGLDLSDMAPSAPYMGTSPDHYAAGYVSRKNQGFQGRHRERMLFIFDEANDVDALHWVTTRTMADPDLGSAWLAIFNPTSATSQAYQEDMRCDSADGEPIWTRIRLSALDHPNIAAQLRGEPKPVPGAVSLPMLQGWVEDWTEPLAQGEARRFGDREWPPESGQWIRPYSTFQSRALGEWPDEGGGVWGPALFDSCLTAVEPAFPAERLPQVGCDCAQGKGEDFHAIHARWGAVSILHETANTMDAVRIVEGLRNACRISANLVNAHRERTRERVRAQEIKIIIDDDGTGNAVSAMMKREGYNIILVSAASVSRHPDLYPRMRDEAWFNAAEKARNGFVCLNRMDRKTRARLRQQLLAPEWDVDLAGRRVVEKKDITKEKIGRSPDDGDAFNLSHLEYATARAEPVVNYRPPERRVR